jgi:foldase protein PrsA
MKKWLVGAATLGIGLTLAGCGSQSVATIDGNNISKDAFYSSLKANPEAKQVLRDMILDKGLETQYGAKVSTSEVDAKYNEYKAQSGPSFSAFLKQNDLSAAQFKDRIRENLLMQAAVRANTRFTPKMLREQFRAYQPKVVVDQILVSKAATAKEVIAKLAAGQSFATLAKRYSTDVATKDKSGRIAPFDNTNSSLDPAFKSAAFKLKSGEYTKMPVKTQYGYEVIQMIRHPKRGRLSDHENELKNQIVTARMGDSNQLQAITSKVLRHRKITIHDKGLQSALGSLEPQSSKDS